MFDGHGHAVVTQEPAEFRGQAHAVGKDRLGEPESVDLLDDFLQRGEEEGLASAEKDDPLGPETLRLLDHGDDLVQRQLSCQRLARRGVTIGATEIALPGELQLQRQQPVPSQTLGDRFRGKPQLGIQLVTHDDPPWRFRWSTNTRGFLRPPSNRRPSITAGDAR